MRGYKSNRAREHARVGTALTLAFICAIAVFNTIIFALASKYEWYFFKEESYEHNISEASERELSALEGETEIIFCMEKDELESDTIYNLVWQTANQLAEKSELIKIKNVNIYLQPKEVSKYKYTIDENGERVQTARIDKRTVIIATDTEYKVLTLSDFFVLNTESIITAYNGEEVMLSSILWVEKKEHPIAYFTNTHGESFSSLLGLYNMLYASGYEVKMLDLFAEEIDERASLIIMANPIYDIERASLSSGIVSENERLTGFLLRGGTLFVTLDPYVKSELKNLRTLLSEFGMNTNNAIINDAENSITHDGYTLVAQYADTEFGRDFYESVSRYNSSYTVVKDASPITLGKGVRGEASAILTSSSSAKAYENGELSSDEGNFTLLAMSEGEGGRVILSSGAYLAANDAVNSEVYSNRELLFTIMERAGAENNLIGTRIMPIGNNMIEGLTAKRSQTYAFLLVILIPVVIGVASFIILRRRKNR
jgi:ABC-2 type transport system permease protein